MRSKKKKFLKTILKSSTIKNFFFSFGKPSKKVFYFVIVLFLIIIPFIKRPTFQSKGIVFQQNLVKLETPFIFQSDAQKEIPPLLIFQENTLVSAAPYEKINYQTFGVAGADNDHQIIEYIVKKGDTVSKIAKDFNIDVNTILWANNLSSKSILREGQKLIILPVSGVLHLVEEGDTILKIAKLYKVSAEKIVEFNDIKDDKILVGDILIIPGGKKPEVAPQKRIVKVPKSYFICPIPSPCHITQGHHWYNAVDFSNGRCFDPIYAAAGGTVQKIGYSRIAGRYIRILHPNGVVTFYGHLAKIIVKESQQVSQGQIIGYMGYSGYTIPEGPQGCHLHFDVFFGKNPFAY